MLLLDTDLGGHWERREVRAGPHWASLTFTGVLDLRLDQCSEPCHLRGQGPVLVQVRSV